MRPKGDGIVYVLVVCAVALRQGYDPEKCSTKETDLKALAANTHMFATSIALNTAKTVPRFFGLCLMSTIFMSECHRRDADEY